MELLEYIENVEEIKSFRTIDNRTIYNFQQKTIDWLLMRRGKITGSDFFDIVEKYKKRQKKDVEEKEVYDSYMNYIYKKVAENYFNIDVEEEEIKQEKMSYNINIARGNRDEEPARQEYIKYTGEVVKQVGFILLNDFVGCSPDGVIYENEKEDKIKKIIEIKCHNESKFVNYVINRNYIEKEYYWQCLFNMYVCNCEECDFINYFNCSGNKIIIQKIRLTEDKKKQIEEIINTAIEDIKENLTIFKFNLLEDNDIIENVKIFGEKEVKNDK